MGLFTGRASAPSEPAATNVPRCDACKSVGPQALEWATMEGIPLIVCVEPSACRRRWERASGGQGYGAVQRG